MNLRSLFKRLFKGSGSSQSARENEDEVTRELERLLDLTNFSAAAGVVRFGPDAQARSGPSGQRREIAAALARGANPNGVQGIGLDLRPVVAAALIDLNYDAGVLGDLLNAGANPNALGPAEQGNSNQGTALHYLATADNALMEGRVMKVMKLLVARAADPNSLDDQGRTPLHVAVAKRNYFGVRCLLGVGADPRRTDSQGRAVLETLADAPADDAMVKSIREAIGGASGLGT